MGKWAVIENIAWCAAFCFVLAHTEGYWQWLSILPLVMVNFPEKAKKDEAGG